MNVELLREVRKCIQMCPDDFEMSDWVRRTDCGTKACTAGWTVMLGDGLSDGQLLEMNRHAMEPGQPSIQTRAQELLGLSNWQAQVLFFGIATEFAAKGIAEFIAEYA